MKICASYVSECINSYIRNLRFILVRCSKWVQELLHFNEVELQNYYEEVLPLFKRTKCNYDEQQGLQFIDFEKDFHCYAAYAYVMPFNEYFYQTSKEMSIFSGLLHGLKDDFDTIFNLGLLDVNLM